jgi:HopA1 effector protein family
VGPYPDQIVAALRAVTIRGPSRYAWLGRGSRPLPVSLDADLDESDRRTHLVACLREELYCSFYCHGAPVPARWGAPEPVSADPWLVEAMSQANTGRGSWEPGWRVERLKGQEVVVATDHLRTRVSREDTRAASGAVRPGAAVSVRLPKELPSLSPGFCTLVSDAPRDSASSASVVRVYWNISRAGVPPLVATLTSRLNGEYLPFRLKVADHPFRLERCDAAVLYLAGEIFQALRETLREVAAALTSHLRPEIPAFTLALAPGVGLAEDEGGESFGARRCALLADGIVRAHVQGLKRMDARFDAVVARFAEDGVMMDAPYLEPSLAGRHVL